MVPLRKKERSAREFFAPYLAVCGAQFICIYAHTHSTIGQSRLSHLILARAAHRGSIISFYLLYIYILNACIYNLSAWRVCTNLFLFMRPLYMEAFKKCGRRAQWKVVWCHCWRSEHIVLAQRDIKPTESPMSTSSNLIYSRCLFFSVWWRGEKHFAPLACWLLRLGVSVCLRQSMRLKLRFVWFEEVFGFHLSRNENAARPQQRRIHQYIYLRAHQLVAFLSVDNLH